MVKLFKNEFFAKCFETHFKWYIILKVYIIEKEWYKFQGENSTLFKIVGCLSSVIGDL